MYQNDTPHLGTLPWFVIIVERTIVLIYIIPKYKNNNELQIKLK